MYFSCLVYVFLLFSYPDWGFSMLFPQLWGKCQGITGQDGARPALFLNVCVALCIVCFVSCVLFVCKCVLCYCHRVLTQLHLNISYHILTVFNVFRHIGFFMYPLILCSESSAWKLHNVLTFKKAHSFEYSAKIYLILWITSLCCKPLRMKRICVI
jgi:hypothetical protein